jgi:hypothetical protein
VEMRDSLLDTICLSCLSNLKSLIDFKKICVQNDEVARLKLTACLDIKVEEVLLEDLILEDDIFDGNSQLYKSPVGDDGDEKKSSSAEEKYSVRITTNEVKHHPPNLQEKTGNIDELSLCNTQYNNKRKCSPVIFSQWAN